MNFSQADMSEITVAIPTKNSIKSITFVLEQLKLQLAEAKTGLKVLVCDNGSNDGTFEAVARQVQSNYYEGLDITVRQLGFVAGGKTANIPFMRKMLCELVTTPYVFWLDSDVAIPPNALMHHFREFLKVKANVGLFGIRYTPNADHVQMGASFMETSVARRIQWKWEEHICDCKNVKIQLGQMPEQFGTLESENLLARHVKNI